LDEAPSSEAGDGGPDDLADVLHSQQAFEPLALVRQIRTV
jgi:hypothetical protein